MSQVGTAVVSGSDDFAMPAPNGVRCDDAATGFMEPLSECLNLDGKSSSLIVAESNSHAWDKLAKDAILFADVIDNSRLLTVQPSRERDHEEIPGIREHGMRL